jgi:lysyl-tRNA synthetase class 1
MSSSKGRVVDLPTLLRVYTPPLVRYLFAGTRPNTEFTISFDLDVIKIYEDYDKCERIAWGIDKAKSDGLYRKERRIYELSQAATTAEGKSMMPAVQPYQAPFRHLCNLVQIHDGNIDAALEALEPAPKPEQLPALKARAERARYWAQECAPDEFRFRLRDSQKADTPAPALSAAEIKGVQVLRDTVIARLDQFSDDKAVSSAIYAAAESAGLEGKALFRAAYQALIGKDQGPRLASFIRTIGSPRLMAILAAY